jgi:hypothetical protein
MRIPLCAAQAVKEPTPGEGMLGKSKVLLSEEKK